MYKEFANIYDQFMDSKDYDTWYKRLKSSLDKYKFKGKTVLDLACGTGEMTERLASDGYKMMGLDLSSDMLEIAQNKSYEKRLRINYIQQNILDMEVFHPFDGMISFCDGFNYILSESELFKSFEKVSAYTKKDGFFIFDMSSDVKLKGLHNQTIAETSEDAAFIWENFFDEDTSLLDFDLTVFKMENGVYKRFEECHQQRAYTRHKIKETLESTGFELLETLDTQTGLSVTEHSERWMFIGRKK